MCLQCDSVTMLFPPNIEFSCPAASTQNRVELPDCIHCCRRPLRGQLQRFVRRSLAISRLPCIQTPLVSCLRCNRIGCKSYLPINLLCSELCTNHCSFSIMPIFCVHPAIGLGERQ